ncbi:RHS repeat-associated core domain-containing protein [Pseudomonas sp. IT-P176]|uniref:RHS repeat-associated core domain-containing protein n=1 Tax=Pseudomonas sp. IT-P176 TaxID=3026444 RepID=UPI0039DFFFAE
MGTQQPVILCSYGYDPLDRLIYQSLPDTPVHERFYCKSRLATETQGATKYSIVQHDDLLLAQQQRDGDALDTTLLSTDLQRSVLHTLKKDHPRHPIAYSPYGHRPALSGLLSLLGFNGERPDPVTGHYLLGNGYRAFNPVLMRFNSPDSWSPFGKGGLNTYAYCLGDPNNANDPSGRNPSKKSISNSLFKKDPTSPLPPPGERIGLRTYPDKARRLSDPGPTTPPLSEPDFMGVHGSSRADVIKLLKEGVQPHYSKTERRRGFYFTPDKDIAYDYADSRQYKSTKEEIMRNTNSGKDNIVEVHIQNLTGKIPGKDYDFNYYSFTWPNTDHMTMEFIAMNHIARSIVIRRLGTTPPSQKVRPRALEAPF